MDKLAKTQKQFVQSITSGNFDSEFMEGMVPLGKLNPQKAMEVYRGDYTARMQEALGDIYETIWTVLGDSGFHQLAQDYIAEHPSTSYSLGDYGGSFPQFIGGHRFLQDFPFLADLAGFEWQFMEVFHAPYREALGPEHFQEIPNPFALKLKLGQEHFLLDSPFPIWDIWEARKQSEAPELDWSKACRMIIFKGPETISYKELTPLQFFIIQGLNEEKTLEKSLIAASDSVSDFKEQEISELFAFLVGDGLITALS